ncbi:CLUMA_CG009173, isoform A [Clunio marinus]|uniref:CLUMA_CG009173, isoform A n=1 Tax=Clunio marinus TaxID=568069 RepID=A0A1J1I812_9DIPT|nr:CLUMA_CG009173, isoform A [Clunio marinus]
MTDKTTIWFGGIREEGMTNMTEIYSKALYYVARNSFQQNCFQILYGKTRIQRKKQKNYDYKSAE